MADPTPAEELRTAAAYVRVVVEANRAIAENRVIPLEVQGLTLVDVARADMHPAVGAALADWLEQAARAFDATVTGALHVWGDATDPEAAEFIGRGPSGGSEALAVARAISGGPR